MRENGGRVRVTWPGTVRFQGYRSATVRAHLTTGMVFEISVRCYDKKGRGTMFPCEESVTLRANQTLLVKKSRGKYQ